MKRILLSTLLYLLLVVLIPILYGCADTPPEKQTGTITFIITEENTPQALSGVSVQLFSDFDTSVMPIDRTDNSGCCTFSDIPIGTYKMTISKPGYESKTDISLRINGGNNPYMEISLKRSTTTLTVAPDVLDFGDNESVVQKAFSLVNPNYEDLTWVVLDADVPWIVSVCDKDGKESGTIKYNQEVAMSITIDRDALISGNNESTIVILSDYGRAELKIIAVGADRRFPITEITEVTDIDLQTATFKGKVLSVGAPEYDERGFVYSTSAISENATDGFIKITAPMNSEDTFSVAVNGLDNGVTYYVRAYGKNDLGLKLSSIYKTFTTIADRTSVATQPVTQVDVVNGTAQFNGTITEIGSPAYSEKGFCYNTVGEPTISDTKYTVSGTSGGDYCYLCAGLSINTTYYVRAYAIQNDKIYYGTSEVFDMGKIVPSINTNEATNVMYTTATLNGTITSVGEPRYEQRGFYYGTDSSPTSDNSNTFVENANSLGNYSKAISGLKENTTYYYRAFVIQPGEVNPIMGEVSSFTTGLAPNVTTGGIINISCSGANEASLNWSATLYGGLSDIGLPAFTEFGFVYGKNNQPRVNDGSSVYTTTIQYDMYDDARIFYVDISGLTTGQHYYIRAVATTPLGYVYGEPVEFTPTVIAPVIRTYSTECRYIYGTGWAVSFVGAAGSLGQPAATGLGFVYGLESMPTVGDGVSKAVTYTKIETQDEYYVYGVAVTGLQAGKDYYVRTYAKTPLGYTYGETLVFRTY